MALDDSNIEATRIALSGAGPIPNAVLYNNAKDLAAAMKAAGVTFGGTSDPLPIGSVVSYSGATIPTGYLDADGSSQLRASYPDLFNVIGTTYGAGSVPGTTFALPNFVGTYTNFIIKATAAAASTTVVSETLIAVPLGSLQLYAGSVYPTGWLRADGTAISRTTYAGLFAIIGTTYGAGDGSTTFNLPNLVSSGTASPVYIIKVTLSGSVEPSTVAHASSHIRAGTDVIDGDRVQIDYVPSFYTRNAAASGAGAVTDLTAHLSGIDTLSGTAFYKTSASSSGESNTVNINTLPWNMPWGNVFKRVSSGSNVTVSVGVTTVFPSLTGSVTLRNDRIYHLMTNVNMYGPSGATNCTFYFAINGSTIQNGEFTPRSAIGNSCTMHRYYTPGTTASYTVDVRGVFTGGGGAFLNDGGREGYFLINDIGPA